MHITRTGHQAELPKGLDRLKNSSEYSEDNTVFVCQHEAAILDARISSVKGLYTSGAGSCAILIAIQKDPKTNDVGRVGMAHIDVFIDSEQIAHFLDEVKGANGHLEVYVIGGEKRVVSCIAEACGDSKAQIKCRTANLQQNREDSAIVDCTGTVYYGKRKDLDALFDKEKMKRMVPEIIKGIPLSVITV